MIWNSWYVFLKILRIRLVTLGYEGLSWRPMTQKVLYYLHMPNELQAVCFRVFYIFRLIYKNCIHTINTPCCKPIKFLWVEIEVIFFLLYLNHIWSMKMEIRIRIKLMSHDSIAWNQRNNNDVENMHLQNLKIKHPKLFIYQDNEIHC